MKADAGGSTLAITMTNDSVANALRVYDAVSGTLRQTLPTEGLARLFAGRTRA